MTSVDFLHIPQFGKSEEVEFVYKIGTSTDCIGRWNYMEELNWQIYANKSIQKQIYATKSIQN